MAASEEKTDDDQVAVEDLRDELQRKEEELEVVIEQYERVIDTRSRLRREADGTFVWTGQEHRSDEQRSDDAGVVRTVLEWFP